MPKLLSTKVLPDDATSRLLTAGFSLVQYDAIRVNLKETPIHSVENALITSQNAVQAMLQSGTTAKRVFCVGKQTKSMLQQAGFYVELTADCAADLAQKIVSEHPKLAFHFFCGNRRRDDLPTILKQHQIAVTETEVYESIDVPKRFSQDFDLVLFFSPSAVHSFYSINKMPKAKAIAIGNTTAEAVRQYTHNLAVAASPEIKQVVITAIKLKNEIER